MAQPCDIQIVEVIGQGEYGLINKVKASDGNFYALKSLLNKDDNKTNGVESPVELNIMFGIQSPYLQKGLKIYAPQECNDFIGILQPWSQYDFIQYMSINPSSQDIKTIFLQLALGLRCLHKKGYLHLDIKNSNILIDQTPLGVIAKHTDFGLSSLFTNGIPLKTHQEKVTPIYRPPEGFDQDINYMYSMSPKIDIWSLGMVYLYTINNFNYLFYNCRPDNMIELEKITYHDEAEYSHTKNYYNAQYPYNINQFIKNPDIIIQKKINMRRPLRNIHLLARERDDISYQLIRYLVEPYFPQSVATDLMARTSHDYFEIINDIETLKEYVDVNKLFLTLFGFGNIAERSRYLFAPGYINEFIRHNINGDIINFTEMETFVDLMSHILCLNVEDRYTVDQIIDHPYFSNIKPQVKATTGDACTTFPIYPIVQSTFTTIHEIGLADLITTCTEKISDSTVSIMFLAIDIYIRGLQLCGPHLTHIDCEVMSKSSISLAYKFYMNANIPNHIIRTTRTESIMEIHIIRALEGIIYRDISPYAMCRTRDQLILLYKYIIENNSSLSCYLRIDIGFFLELLSLRHNMVDNSKDITIKLFKECPIPPLKE
jgi:serine/threonine protein kinase